MKRIYPLYEAKARLSQIIREVRVHRQAVTISYHGKPVAEIRPIETAPGETALQARVRELTQRGVLSAPGEKRLQLRRLAKRSGALDRFLKDRD